MTGLTPYVRARVAKRSQTMTDWERAASVVSGAFLVGAGLKSRSALGLLGALAGGYLAYRGYTGVCPLSVAMGLQTSNGQRNAAAPRPKNVPHTRAKQFLDTSSEDSFPASDPPAHQITKVK